MTTQNAVHIQVEGETVGADHIKEPYIKQIEDSSHSFKKTVDQLHELEKTKGKNSSEWKTQLSKCEVQGEHYWTLVEGFTSEFKKKYKDGFAPDPILKLKERVGKQNVAVKMYQASIKK